MPPTGSMVQPPPGLEMTKKPIYIPVSIPVYPKTGLDRAVCCDRVYDTYRAGALEARPRARQELERAPSGRITSVICAFKNGTIRDLERQDIYRCVNAERTVWFDGLKKKGKG